MFNIPDKILATTQDSPARQNSDEKQYCHCQHWMLRLVVLLPARLPANRQKKYFFSWQKNIFTAIIFTCRVLLTKSWILCSLLPFLVSKNDDETFSQPFSSCFICVNSGFPNFRSNYFWHIDFSWNKVVRVDSRAPINATRSEKVWKPLKSNRRTKVGTTKDIFLRGTTHKRCILSRFSDKWPNTSHLCGAPKTNMA